jgi:hypothetical protein
MPSSIFPFQAPHQQFLATNMRNITPLRNGGVAQATGCLLGKGKALSSNPSPTKKKTQKTKKTERKNKQTKGNITPSQNFLFNKFPLKAVNLNT